MEEEQSPIEKNASNLRKRREKDKKMLSMISQEPLMEASAAIYAAAAEQEEEEVSPLITSDITVIEEKKRKCYKNLVIFSLSFFFAFSAFNGLGNLQSTLNKEGHMGVTSLFIASIAYFFSCLLLPSLTIKHFGYKWSLFFCQLTISFYICANFYAKWWTLYPTAALFGLASGPLWTIQGCFITDLAKDYALLSKEKSDAVISRFFGIFMIIFQFQQVVGNFISSFVLKKDSNIPWQNFTVNITDHSHCGAIQCVDMATAAAKENQISIPLDLYSVKVMCVIYLVISLLGVTMVALFLDNVKHKAQFQSTVKSLLGAVSLFKDWKAWCLVPITAMTCFIGIFISTDVTKSFIACLGGIDYIGYWFCLFGVVASLNAFIVGHTVKYLGRLIFFLAAFAIIIGLHMFMLFWKPQTSQFYVVFLLPLFYGYAEGVWSTQINSMIGTIFHGKEQQAFANNRLCSSIMLVIGYAYSAYLCVRWKVYAILASAALSLVTLVALEVKLRAASEYSNIPDSEEKNKK